MLLLAMADEGGVSAESGDTLFAEGTAFNLSLFHFRKTKLYEGANRVRNPAGEEEEGTVLLASGLYALDADTNVGLVLPYVENDEDSGMGDATLFLKRRVYYTSDSDAGWAFTTAFALALQVPSGESREEGVPPEEQPGSGSWDPFAGLAATYEVGRVFANVFANYQRNTEGSHDFKHGDIAVLGTTAGWRPWMEPYPGPMLVLETGLTWEHEFAAVEDGDRLDDSGSDVLFVPLRVKFAPRSGYNFSAGLDLPVYRSYRDEQLATDYRLALGFGWVF